MSTNSICQGQQVTPLWRPLFEDGIRINFAHRSFVWGNEAENQAHVHVVIIGFSYQDEHPKYLFEHPKEGESRRYQVEHINGYLTAAPDVFVERRAKPLCDVVPMIRGCQPTDAGNLLLWQEEKDQLVAKEPAAEKWIRPFSMGAEFINGKPRYCLWLVECPPPELAHLPLVLERVRRVKEMRQSSAKAATRKKADTPWLFDEIRPPQGNKYIAMPAVSSERRKYVPIGFVDNGMIPGNKLYFIPTADIYHFGVLISQFHNAWMRVVAGRLKSDYNYGNTTVYNTFIWPDSTPQQKRAIEEAAALVLEKRKAYAPATLAELYDPDNDFLYPELTRAHAQLDRAVEAAYGVDFAGDETKITAHLFTLYQAATTS